MAAPLPRILGDQFAPFGTGYRPPPPEDDSRSPWRVFSLCLHGGQSSCGAAPPTFAVPTGLWHLLPSCSRPLPSRLSLKVRFDSSLSRVLPPVLFGGGGGGGGWYVVTKVLAVLVSVPTLHDPLPRQMAPPQTVFRLVWSTSRLSFRVSIVLPVPPRAGEDPSSPSAAPLSGHPCRTVPTRKSRSLREPPPIASSWTDSGHVRSSRWEPRSKKEF